MSRDLSWRNDFRNPAAAALKNRRVIRDARASNAQITAEQLIANAKELEAVVGTAKPATRVLLTSPEEIAIYRQRMRGEFEGQLKQGYKILSKWLEYAEWEESQNDHVRAASVYERAKGPHAERTEYWRAYAEFQIRRGWLDEARAVFSRGVTVLPQSDELWLKFLLLEQAAMEDHRVRDLFERWLTTGRPGPYAWELAIQFEVARGDVDRGRSLLSRYVAEHNTPKAWVFYAKTEQAGFADADRATEVLITALEALPDRYADSNVYSLLGKLLRDAGRFEDARRVYVDFTQHAKFDEASRLFADYSRLERELAAGSDESRSSDIVTLAQARLRCEKEISQSPSSFDSWLSLALVEHASGERLEARDKALLDGSKVSLPAAESKDVVQITKKASLTLGAAQALLQKGDVDAARELLASTIQNFPHAQVAYPPIWIQAADLERQQGDLAKARKIYGAALGMAPHPVLYKAYRQLEREEQSPDMAARLRKIFDAEVARSPINVDLWVEYATFETEQREYRRCDAILAAALTLFIKRIADFSKDRAVMEDIDALWMARIRLSLVRTARQPQGSEQGGAEAPTTSTLFQQLVEFTFDRYAVEYEVWRREHLEKGTPGAPPRFLPKSLAVGAVERFAESVRAMINFAVGSPGADSASAVTSVREFMSSLAEKARRRGNAWVEQEAGRELSFLQLQDSKHLVELFVAPIYREWTAFEAEHGDAETLKAVTTSAEAPVKKRTRLFKK